jgi:hypothetical protein
VKKVYNSVTQGLLERANHFMKLGAVDLCERFFSAAVKRSETQAEQTFSAQLIGCRANKRGSTN